MDPPSEDVKPRDYRIDVKIPEIKDDSIRNCCCLETSVILLISTEDKISWEYTWISFIISQDRLLQTLNLCQDEHKKRKDERQNLTREFNRNPSVS